MKAESWGQLGHHAGQEPPTQVSLGQAGDTARVGLVRTWGDLAEHPL